jgi:hypothetical protein
VDDFSIPIHIAEQHGLRRTAEAVRIGVPMTRGLLRSPYKVVATDSRNEPVPLQASPLAFWPDRSVKWLLIDTLVSINAGERLSLFLRPGWTRPTENPGDRTDLQIRTHADGVEVDTGRARFGIRNRHSGMFTSVAVGALEFLRKPGSSIQLTGADGKIYTPIAEQTFVEEQGPVRAVVVSAGAFHSKTGPSPLRFQSRVQFIVGSAAVSVEFQIRNVRAAHHPGGMWDLGDPGSWFFKDLSLAVYPAGTAQTLHWYSNVDSERELPNEPWFLYQDSSGGDAWDSPNHIDCDSRSTVSFRGFRVSTGTSDKTTIIAEGRRATPGLTVVSNNSWVSAGVSDFWQNFPKSLRWNGEPAHGRAQAAQRP